MTEKIEENEIYYPDKLSEELEVKIEEGLYDGLSMLQKEYSNTKNYPLISELEESLLHIYNLSKHVNSLEEKNYYDNHADVLAEANRFILLGTEKNADHIEKLKDIIAKSVRVLNVKANKDYVQTTSPEALIRIVGESYFFFLLTFFPFLLKNKNFSFKITRHVQIAGLEETLKSHKEFFVIDLIKNQGEVLAKSLKETLEKNKMELIELLIALQPLLHIYSSLDTESRKNVMHFIDTLIWAESKTYNTFLPSTLDDSFWADFLSFKKEKGVTRAQKIINNSGDYDEIQEWFIHFWKGQKEIPKVIQVTLKEIEKVNVEKEKAKREDDLAKVLTETPRDLNQLKAEIVIAQEKVRIDAPKVYKLSKEEKDEKYFTYNVSPKEGFDIQFCPKGGQWKALTPEEIENGIDLSGYATNGNKLITFRYFKEGNYEFEKIEILLPKKPRKKGNNDDWNLGDSIGESETGRFSQPGKEAGPSKTDEENDLLKNKEVVPGKEEEKIKIEKEVLKKKLAETLEMYKENVDEIFTSMPRKITSDEFEFRFSVPFILFCEQGPQIKFNVADDSIDFGSLEMNEKSRKILENYVRELLKERVEAWNKEKRKLYEKLLPVKEQKEQNEWFKNFDEIMDKAAFFYSSQQLEKLISKKDESVNGDKSFKYQDFFNYIQNVAVEYRSRNGEKTDIVKSREILEELLKAGIEASIGYENRKVRLFGSIKISDEREEEFNASWNSKEQFVKIEKLNGSINFQRKITNLLRNIFLKIFWEVLEDSSMAKKGGHKLCEIFAGIKLADKDKLDKFWTKGGKNKKESVKKNKKDFLNKLSNGDCYVRLKNGKIIKYSKYVTNNPTLTDGNGGSLDDENVVSYVLNRDNLKTNDESNLEKTRNIAFNSEMYEPNSPVMRFLHDQQSEQYLLKRIKLTVDNYIDFGEDFAKYYENGKTSFKNKGIVKIISELVEEFKHAEVKISSDDGFKYEKAEELSMESFVTKKTEDINMLVISHGKDKAKKSFVHRFLEEMENARIPLVYSSAHESPRLTMKSELEGIFV